MVLPVYELTSVPEELRDVCWAINQVLNIRPKVDIFVPDLSRVSAWAQDGISSQIISKKNGTLNSHQK